MATIQQLEKLHHIQRLFHVEDSLEAAVAGERVKELIEKTEQLIRQRAFLREERRVLRISAEKLEERKQELKLMSSKDWVPEQLRKLPQRCIQINIAGLMFEISEVYMMRDPSSLLHQLCGENPPILPDADGSYFFDRDWWLFRYIVVFLRDGTLPEDRAVLAQLYREAGFWNLTEMQRASRVYLAFLHRMGKALLLLGLFAAAEAATARFTSNQDVAKNRPVTKVINLLKDMNAQLEKEGKEDEEVFEKITCWCQTNDKDKTTSIDDAEGLITDLTATIEEETASSARLNTEIKNLASEIAKNQAALDKATGIRQKELAEFNGEEKDVLQSIGALKSAITVLGKHHAELLQVPTETLINVAVMIQDQFHKHKALVDKITTPSQRKAVTAFVQSPSDYFDAEPTFKQSYAPQSGAIFGILKQMKETFESNLSSSQKEEMQSQAAFEDLKAAKESEIKAGSDQKDTKTQELADTDEKLAQAKQDLEDTRNSLAADQKFLLNLKETCQMTDQEFEERTKTRAEEMKAVSEALAILSSDDAHDTFTSTFNFIQVSKATQSKRDHAEKILYAVAKKTGHPRLATLATRVRLDNFKKVTEEIDGMIADLKKEKADDVKMKDFCIEALHKNEVAQEMKKRDIEQMEAKIADLTASIEELTKAIAKLTAEIAEMQVQLKRAGEDRELENKDFQQVVADQRETKKLLSQALNVLKGFYDKAFVQAKATQPAGPPPPPGFKKYEKSSGAGGVMGMLEQIIAETETMEADAIKAETDAQKAYESFVKDTNASMEEKSREITNKSEEKAVAEADKVAEEESLATALNELQELMNENADLHKSCDFTLDNFDARQAALEQEMDGLREAKSVLAGSMGFLQTK